MTEPAAVGLALSFQQDLIRRDSNAILNMSKRWLNVESSLDGLINDLSGEIDKLTAAGESIPPWKLYQMERYQALMAQLQGQMNYFSQAAIGDLLDDGKKAQFLAQKHAKQMAGVVTKAAGLGTLARADMVFDRLNVDLAEKISALARAGFPLDELMNKAWPLAANGLTQKLITGAALGWNPRKMAQQAKLGMADGFNHLLLVYRDQVNRNYRETTRELYQSSGLVYGYMRVASRSERTCMACIRLDGTIYPTSQTMALHPQDRCTMIPLIRGVDPPRRQSGLDWFREQDPDLQRKMLGAGRFNAWKAGVFDLDQIVTIKPNPTWGPSAQVTSLKSLLQGGGGLQGAPGQDGVPMRNLADLLAQVKTQDVAQIQARPPAPPAGDKTVHMGNGDSQLARDLAEQIKATEPADPGEKLVNKGMVMALEAVDKKGAEAITILAPDGSVKGVISYSKTLNNVHVHAAGFKDPEANLDALKQLAAVAKESGLDIDSYVPKDLINQYEAWGWDVVANKAPGKIMRLKANQLDWFIDDPAKLAEGKLIAYHTQQAKNYQDPDQVAEFKPGKPNPYTSFTPVKLEKGDIEKYKMDFATDHARLKHPEEKYKAAGMILVDEATGKIVMVAPAGQYGGYKNTMPKGTKEQGDDLQTTAIKEAWEETGLVPQIVGYLGDYEKGFSVARYYVGVVKGGAPWDLGTPEEAEAIKLVPEHQALDLLNNAQDKQIFEDWLAMKAKATTAGNGDWKAGLAVLDYEQAEHQTLVHNMANDWAIAWTKNKINFTLADMQKAHEYLAAARHPLAREMAENIKDQEQAQAAAVREAEKAEFEATRVWNAWLTEGPAMIGKFKSADIQQAKAWAVKTGQESWDLEDLDQLIRVTRTLEVVNKRVEQPDGLTTKKDMVTDLAAQAKVPFWKLNQLKVDEIKALYGQTVGDVQDAAEAGAAKYYAGKAAQNALEQAQNAPEREKAVIQLPSDLQQGTKAQVVNYLVRKTGVAKWKINQLGVDQIKALDGRSIDAVLKAGEAGAQKYYQAAKDKKMAAKKGANQEQNRDLVKGPDSVHDVGNEWDSLASQLKVPYHQVKMLTLGEVQGLWGKPKLEALALLKAKVDQEKATASFDDALLGWGEKGIGYFENLDLASLELVKKHLVDEGMNLPTLSKDLDLAIGEKKEILAAIEAAAVKPKPAPGPKWEPVNWDKEFPERPRSQPKPGLDPVKEGDDLFQQVASGQLPKYLQALTEILSLEQLEYMQAATKGSTNDKWNQIYVQEHVEKMIEDKKMALDHDPFAQGMKIWNTYSYVGKNQWGSFDDFLKDLDLEEMKNFQLYLNTSPTPWGQEMSHFQDPVDAAVAKMEQANLRSGQFLDAADDWRLSDDVLDKLGGDDDLPEPPPFYEYQKTAFDNYQNGDWETEADLKNALRYAEKMNPAWSKSIKDDLDYWKSLHPEPADSPGVEYHAGKATQAQKQQAADLITEKQNNNAWFAYSQIYTGLTVDFPAEGIPLDAVPIPHLQKALAYKGATAEGKAQIEEAIKLAKSANAVEAFMQGLNVDWVKGEDIFVKVWGPQEHTPTQKESQDALEWVNWELAKGTVGWWTGDTMINLKDTKSFFTQWASLPDPTPRPATVEQLPDNFNKYDPDHQKLAFNEWADLVAKGEDPLTLGETKIWMAKEHANGTASVSYDTFKTLERQHAKITDPAYRWLYDNTTPKTLTQAGQPTPGDAKAAYNKLVDLVTDQNLVIKPDYLIDWTKISLEEVQLAKNWLAVGPKDQLYLGASDIDLMTELKIGHLEDDNEIHYDRWKEGYEIKPAFLELALEYANALKPHDSPYIRRDLDQFKAEFANLKPSIDQWVKAYADGTHEQLPKHVLAEALEYAKDWGWDATEIAKMEAAKDQALDPAGDPLFVKWQNWNAYMKVGDKPPDKYKLSNAEYLQLYQAYPEQVKVVMGWNDKDLAQVMDYIDGQVKQEQGFSQLVTPTKGLIPFPPGVKALDGDPDNPTGFTYQGLVGWVALWTGDSAADLKKQYPTKADLIGLFGGETVTNEDDLSLLGQTLIDKMNKGQLKLDQLSESGLLAVKAWSIQDDQAIPYTIQAKIDTLLADYQGLPKIQTWKTNASPEEVNAAVKAAGVTSKTGLDYLAPEPTPAAKKVAQAAPAKKAQEPVSEKAPTFSSKAPKTAQGKSSAAAGSIPLPKGKTADSVQNMKKATLVNHVGQYVSIPKGVLEKMTVKELVTFMTPPDTGPAHAGAITLDVSGADSKLKDKLGGQAKADMTAQYQVKGIDKFLGSIGGGGARGFVYKDDQGKVVGVAGWVPSGGTLKLTAASFADPETNMKALADGLKTAESMGLSTIQTWVPTPYKKQYENWGFKTSESSYMVADINTLSVEVKALATPAGETVKQSGVGPIPFPSGTVNKAQAAKLPKADLVNHFNSHTGIAKTQLDQVAKDDLVQLLGQENITAAVDGIVAHKEKLVELKKAWDPYESKGPAGIKTSKQGLKVLEYVGEHDLDLDPADLKDLQGRIDQLAQEEKEASPYVVYDPIQPFNPKLHPPKAVLPQHEDFPADPKKMVKVKDLGGSTGAQLVKDPATGKQYVMKQATAKGGQEHLRGEASADAMYQAAGLNVPRFQLYETPSGPVKLAEFMGDAVDLGTALKRASPAEKEKILDQVRDGFAMDALMGNWDVMGMSQDNILVRDGIVYRVDNGGSLRFRAQGGDKNSTLKADGSYIGDSVWSEYPDDIWSMRVDRGGASSHNAKVFGQLDWYDICDQSDRLAKNFNAIVAAAPPEEREIVHKRLERMRFMGQVGSAHKKDGFIPWRPEQISRAAMKMEKAGMIEKVAKKMDNGGPGSTSYRDENGVKWDRLKSGGYGEGESLITQLAEIMRQNGANHRVISDWRSSQGSDSWKSETMQAAKWGRMKQRPDNLDEYYVGEGNTARSREDGMRKIQQAYRSVVQRYGGEEVYDLSFAYQQAFVIQIMRHMDFDRNHPERGYVEICRTENYGATAGALKMTPNPGVEVDYRRGAVESGSLARVVEVYGGPSPAAFFTRLPYHRLYGLYWEEKSPGANNSGFLGEGENEFVFDGAGLPTTYMGRGLGGTDTDSLWKKIYSATGDDPNRQ